MKIDVTNEQRWELNSIIELLESKSHENKMLGFSLLESNFEFLKQYVMPARHDLDGAYFIEDMPFLHIMKSCWAYAAAQFLKNILAGFDQFKLIGLK